jgi:predicted phage baseplate assembly protein
LSSNTQAAAPLPIQLYTLDEAPLTWFVDDATGLPAPEIVLQQPDDSDTPSIWRYRHSLLDAGAYDNAFTIDPASYRQIARNSDGSLQYDYDGDGGETIRFGGSSFGINPDPGTRFVVTYRTSAGVAGNVAAGAISQLSLKALSSGLFSAVSNPLPASGGRDAETLQTVRRLAPQAFQAKQFRAVTLSDYRTTAETLPWVQRAGAASRWTGSWLTNFTTPDPRGSEHVTIDQCIDLVTLLNRYRMAGTESYVDDPDYVSLDLDIHICARPDAFAGDVKRRLMAALSPAGPVGGKGGFFAPDNFSFGQPLERSALESAIQKVPGVAGVRCVHYRVRGRSAGLADMGDVVPAGVHQIIRCNNDPSTPERGAFSVMVEGGR